MSFPILRTTALALVGIAAASSVSAQVIRVATSPAAPHPWIDAAEMFKAEVEANTNFTVEIFPGGQLGNDATVVDEMRIGTVDILLGGSQNVSPFVRDFEFFSLNYLFKDFETFERAIGPDSPVTAHYRQAVEDADVGMTLLGLLGGGIRNLSTANVRVEAPTDLQGVRMRVTGSRLDAETWGAYGAVTTSLPWTELYTAMQTGVVAAFESTLSGFYSARHYEVARYHMRTEHQFMVSHMSMASARLNAMSESDREAIFAAAAKATAHGTATGAEADARLLDELIARGVEVVELEKGPFIEATEALHDEYAERLGLAELLETIREMNAE